MPLNAERLGIDEKGYKDIARNISRMKSLTPRQREEILKRANENLPQNIGPFIRGLIQDGFYDREIFEIAGIPYHKNPEKGIFITALADYFLRNQHRISQQNL